MGFILITNLGNILVTNILVNIYKGNKSFPPGCKDRNKDYKFEFCGKDSIFVTDFFEEVSKQSKQWSLIFSKQLTGPRKGL